MKPSLATLSLAIGLIVSAAGLYQSRDSQADACQALMREASAAAQAPIDPKASERLGFTPMAQFSKVYPQSCQPPNTEADVSGCMIGGALAALLTYLAGRVFARFMKYNHKE